MADPIERLLRDIRDACPSGLWARAVKLSRADHVHLESRDDREIVLRVEAGKREIEVVLYPGDREWECDCDSKYDACEHVAAAALALSQAEESGGMEVSDQARPGQVIYRFERTPGALRLRRTAIADDGSEKPLTRSIAAVRAGLASGPSITGDRLDLEVDRVLGPNAEPVITARLAERLLVAMAGAPRVLLDDRPVGVSADAIGPRARLSRDRGDLVLRVDVDPAIDEVVGPGIAMCGGVLRPISAASICGDGLERLPLVRRFGPGEIGELAGEVLPALERELAVAIDDGVELPGIASSLEPRIDLGLSRRPGGELTALPTLVYGRPPVARIDRDRLVSLAAGRQSVPRRDKRAEAELVDRLRAELDLVPGRQLALRGAEAAALLEKVRASSFAVAGDVAAVPLVAELSGAELRFATRDGGDHATAADVMSAWSAEASVVPLVGGGFGVLPAEWIDENQHLIAALLRAGDEINPAAVGAIAALADSLDAPLPPSLDKLRPLIDGFDGLPELPPPDDLTAELRDYQRRGVDWLGFCRDAGLGAILADDMGLGKTLQVLCALRPGHRSLVVCPTSVLANWELEARRFRPGLSVSRYHGAGRSLDDVDVVLTSYAILWRDIDELAAIDWDAAVLDEAQAIKNPDSLAARAAYRLEAGLRVAMSGTPVENRLDELWSLCHFTNPGLLGGRSDFDRELAKPIAAGDSRAVDRLRATLRPILLRRRKSEVATELPPRTEVVIRCELGDDERAIYDSVRAAARADVAARLSGGGSPMAALAALLRLRQAACHPALLPDSTWDQKLSSKLTELIDRVDVAAAGGHKSLVFSQWTSLLDLIEAAMVDLGLGFVRLDGSTRDRQAVVDAFQSESGPPAMLISLKAGGTGLNLTAADHVFLTDPWWNPAVEAQAADRAHRIGQDKPVVVHRLVAADTVEERMLALQEHKRALADAAITGGAAGGLTADELVALI
jgi:superfamily II DNA or RNA helicase